MGVRQFGGWERALDPETLSCALAAYGALGALDVAGATTVGGGRYAAALRDALRATGTRGERPVLWAAPEALLPPVEHARALAEAWQSAVRDARPEHGSGTPLRMEVRSQLPGAQDPTWLLERLSSPAADLDAVYIGLQGDEVFGAAPVRMRWDWPLDVAVLDIRGSPDLPARGGGRRVRGNTGLSRGAVHVALRRNHWTERYVNIAEPRHGTEAVELLIVPGGAPQALDALARLPVRASFVLLLQRLGGSWEESWSDLRELLRRTGAAGIGVTPAGMAVEQLDAWTDAFIRELSHNSGLDVALYRSFATFSEAPPLLLGHAALWEGTRLHAVADTVRHRAERVREYVRRAIETAPQQGDESGRARAVDTGWAPGATVDLQGVRAGVDWGAYLDRLNRAVNLKPLALEYAHEEGGAADVAETNVAVRSARRETSPPRWIQARVSASAAGSAGTRARPLERAFRPNRLHTVLVRIGPADAGWISGDTRINEPDMPDGVDAVPVQVYFRPLRPAGPTQFDDVMLPREGATLPCPFTLRTGAAGEDIEARVSVFHAGRLLQSALLRGPVGRSAPATGRITLEPEVVVRARPGDLDRRRRFDAALVVDCEPGGAPLVTVAPAPQPSPAAAAARAPQADRRTAEPVDLKMPTGLYDAVTIDIKQALDDAINLSPAQNALDSKETARLLVRLAAQGDKLHDHLVEDQRHGEDLRLAARLQVVETTTAVHLPIEFTYGAPVPDTGAPVCPHAARALRRRGAAPAPPDSIRPCEPGCPPSDAQHTVVCPLGFWGLGKVIERHVHDKNDPVLPTDHQVIAEPSTSRRYLGRLAGAAYAASDKVDNHERHMIRRVLDALQRAAAGTTRSETWAAWRAEVASRRPGLLVALPHTVHDEEVGEPALQIGVETGKELLRRSKIAREVVAAEGAMPIVLLLGCETSPMKAPFVEFPAKFRRSGALLVVATLTEVLGRYAAPVAERLVEVLARRFAAADATFGDVMLEIRRTLVVEGYPTVLALTAYGDTDWVPGERA